MTLNESIGRFNVRKTLRFEMKPVGKTADHLDALLADDEDRAASLNTVKAVIEAEHLTLIRRVFKSLPDPLPDYVTIKEAFKADPEHEILSGRNANAVMKTIVERCRYNRWAVPKQLKDLSGWQPLFIKWHWHCYEQYKVAGECAVARAWAGRTKSEFEATCPQLRTPKKRKPSRNFWFDHGPFRMMFDNHSCGMSWLREDFKISRNFLLKDGDRILIGIVPRSSNFCPYTMARPLPTEQTYLLYEETAGQSPQFRPVPRALVDAPAHRGFIYLFELTGRGLRNKTNLNALYLRALLSTDNFSDPSFHLDKVCEFYARKATDIPNEGKPEHFRQRFTESKFFVSLHITCNPQLVIAGSRPQPYGDLSKLIEANPHAKFIKVAPATGGYWIDDVFLPTAVAKAGGVAGMLAKFAVERDAYVLFDPSVPETIRRQAKDKFDYIVVRGRDPYADGGVMRGYQLVDRLFVGRIEDAQVKVNLRQAEAQRKADEAAALEAARAAKAAEKAAKQAYVEEQMRLAQERRALREKVMTEAPSEVFNSPLFQTGKYLFKFGYKSSDNVRHEDKCRADDKDDVFQKLRTVGIRPYRVECDDPAFVGVRKDLPGPDVGSKRYEYAFRDSQNIRHDGIVLADTREEAYAKLRKLAIKAFYVAEEGTEPPPKRDYTAQVEETIKTVAESQSIASSAPAPAVAAPAQPLGIGDRLKRLNALKEQGLLSDAEYNDQRAKILSEL